MQQDTPPRSVRQWVADLTKAAGEDSRWGRGTARVMDTISRDPSFASYATIGELATRAEVHPSSVTRLSQSFGYAGWPAFRDDLRGIYLGALAHVDVRDAVPADPIAAVIHSDVATVGSLLEPHTLEQIAEFGSALAVAPHAVVVGSGLASAPAAVFGYLSLVAGRDVRLAMGSATSQVAEVSRLRKGDVLILVNVWRTTGVLYALAELAKDRGITVCVLTDLNGSRLERFADHVVVASTESESAVPSVTAMTSAALAIIASADFARDASHVKDVERAWNHFGLMDAHD